MQSLILLLGIGMIVSWGSTGFSVETLEEEVFSEIERRYQDIQTVEGKFDQVMPLEGMGIRREARGIFYIVKPGRSRWEYFEPTRQVFIVKENYLYFKKEKDPGYRKSSFQEQLVGVYTVLLGGDGKFREVFQSSRVKVGERESVEVELIPLERYSRDVKRVILTWNRSRRLVERLTIFSPTGTVNTLFFHDVSVNQPLPSELFATN